MTSANSLYEPLQKFFAAIAIVAIVLAAVPTSVVRANPNTYVLNPNVTICHANKGVKGYAVQTVDASSIINLPNGHNDHNDGGLDDQGDIIPPFTYDFGAGPVNYPGKNWTTVFTGGLTGEQIYNNGGCDGEPAPTTALVTVTKVVQNDNDGTATVSDFDLFVGATPVESGETVEIAPGTYQVTETGTEVANYTASFSGDCTNGSLTVIAGESYACTITNNDIAAPILGCTDQDATNYNSTANQDDGSCLFPLTVVKVLNGETNATKNQFSFTVNGGTPISFDADGSTVVPVANGTYDVVEVSAPGFTATYADCVAIAIAGAGATCTITNTPADQTKFGTLEIKKVVVGVANPDYTAFSYSLNGSAATAFDADGVVAFAAPVGTHTVTEPTVANYTTTYAGCENLVVTEGQTTTCTITNTFVETPICVAEPHGGWADSVVDADQGLLKNGGAITDANRTNPEATLDASDWVNNGSTGFFSLGFGGSVTVAFNSFVPNVAGADISIHEATNGANYPLESASVEVSQNGSTWFVIGVADNTAGDRVTDLDFNSTGLSWIKYVRLTDTTNPALHDALADGFDVDAVFATQTVCDQPADPEVLGCTDPEANNYNPKATKDDGSCEYDNGPKMCTVTLVSGDDENENDRDDNTTVVERSDDQAYLIIPNELWLPITGAGWVWGDETVQNPQLGETQTFERKFGFTGMVTSATLTVSSDDAHVAKMNGTEVGSKPTASHVSGQGVYDVKNYIVNGNNELAIAVTNIGNNSTWNPAGLAYKLVIEGEVTSDDDCSVPYLDGPLYEIYGYVWHDENENDNWDGSEWDEQNYEEQQILEEEAEDPLAGWVVTITNGVGTTLTTETDESGRYEFNVPAGTWTITETLKTNWSQTFPNSGSHVVVVPQLSDVTAAEHNFLVAVKDLFVPTAHAAVVYPTTYGAYNFGNVYKAPTTPTTPSSSGGRGGNGRYISLTDTTPDGEVAGDSTSRPVGEVLGDSVSIMPVGAPNTGAGGAAPNTATPMTLALVGMIASFVTLRTTRNG